MKIRCLGTIFFSFALALIGTPKLAADAQVLPPQSTPTASPTPTPTPRPWRSIEFVSPTLGEAPSGHIEVFRGFAGIKRNGKGAVVCVSFKDTGAVAATRVVFAFELLDSSGDRIATLPLDRRGTFSPGVGIYSWESLHDMEQGGGHRGYGDNCARVDRELAALPLLQARHATFQIKRVEFADGTVWPH